MPGPASINTDREASVNAGNGVPSFCVRGSISRARAEDRRWPENGGGRRIGRSLIPAGPLRGRDNSRKRRGESAIGEIGRYLRNDRIDEFGGNERDDGATE